MRHWVIAGLTSVQVRNTTRDAVVPTFIAFLRRPGGGYTELRGTTAEGGPLEAGGARRYTVTFSGAVEEGATGHLVAAGTGTPATVDVEVSRETGGVTVPGGLAAVLALVAGLALAVAAAALRARRPAPAH